MEIFSLNNLTAQQPGTSGTSRSVAQTILEIHGQILTSQSASRNTTSTSTRGMGSFVTNGYNMLMQVNNRWQEMGKLARLNNTSFPYMIYDQASNQLYVDRQGKILNKRGQYVGILRSV